MDKYTRREAFLQHVKDFISQDPEAAAHVANFVQAGLSEALSEARQRAADMEIALATVSARKYKGADKLVLSKLEKWEGKTALKWD